MFSLLSMSTPRSISTNLLSICMAPCMYWCVGLFLTNCRTLLSLLKFLSAQVSSLSGLSGWQPPHLDDLSATLPSTVISQLTESITHPIMKMINEDVKQDSTPYGPLGYTTLFQPPTRLCTVHHHPQGPTIQPVFNPLQCPPTQPFQQQFEGFWDSYKRQIKSLTEAQVDTVLLSSSPIYSGSHLTVEVYSLVKHNSSLVISHADYFWWPSCPSCAWIWFLGLAVPLLSVS